MYANSSEIDKQSRTFVNKVNNIYSRFGRLYGSIKIGMFNQSWTIWIFIQFITINAQFKWATRIVQLNGNVCLCIKLNRRMDSIGCAMFHTIFQVFHIKCIFRVLTHLTNASDIEYYTNFVEFIFFLWWSIRLLLFCYSSLLIKRTFHAHKTTQCNICTAYWHNSREWYDIAI